MKAVCCYDIERPIWYGTFVFETNEDLQKQLLRHIRKNYEPEDKEELQSYLVGITCYQVPISDIKKVRAISPPVGGMDCDSDDYEMLDYAINILKVFYPNGNYNLDINFCVIETLFKIIFIKTQRESKPCKK